MLNKVVMPRRQLPVWAAFSHAVSSVRDNLKIAFRVSWPWYAVLGISTAIIRLAWGEPASDAHPDIVPALVLAALILVSSAGIAVNWHRYILLDDIPHGGMLLRFDGLMWRYLGNLLLIGLLIFIAMIPFSLVAALLNAQPPGLVAAFFVALPFAGLLFLRLGIKLPAIALGRNDFGFQDAWRATAGNGWQIVQLFLLNIGAAILVSFAIYLIEQVIELASPQAAGFVSFAVEFVANWIFTIFGITILTSLYGFFIQNRDF
ncbi:hypothetical protein BH10PSE7_BH10PSE7_41460 [soil metagenome]